MDKVTAVVLPLVLIGPPSVLASEADARYEHLLQLPYMVVVTSKTENVEHIDYQIRHETIGVSVSKVGGRCTASKRSLVEWLEGNETVTFNGVTFQVPTKSPLVKQVVVSYDCDSVRPPTDWSRAN